MRRGRRFPQSRRTALFRRPDPGHSGASEEVEPMTVERTERKRRGALARRSAGDGASDGDDVATLVQTDATRLARTRALAARGARGTRRGVWVTGRGLVDEVLATAAKLPVRDRIALRAQYPGLSPDEVADALVRGASRATSAVGAAVGVWAVLPVVPAFPVEVAAETLAVVSIEIKLVAELHEVYGMGVSGSRSERMTGYVVAWADRRGAVLLPGGLALAVGSPLRKRLSRRLARRAGRSALSLGPLLTGAAAGAVFNRRETLRLGRTVLKDLRQDPLARQQWT
jgi:hypothetical protein